MGVLAQVLWFGHGAWQGEGIRGLPVAGAGEAVVPPVCWRGVDLPQLRTTWLCSEPEAAKEQKQTNCRVGLWQQALGALRTKHSCTTTNRIELQRVESRSSQACNWGGW